MLKMLDYRKQLQHTVILYKCGNNNCNDQLGAGEVNLKLFTKCTQFFYNINKIITIISIFTKCAYVR